MRGDDFFAASPGGAPRGWPWRGGVSAAGVLLIALWQVFLMAPTAGEGRALAISAATGFDSDTRSFLFFYDTLGLFPLSPPSPPTAYTAEEARLILARDAARIRTQGHVFPRHGNAGRIWLYLPDVWRSGSAENASITPANAALFIGALGALFMAAVLADVPLLGFFLVLLVGSNPFQLYETFGRENIFGWPISLSLLVLALHLHLIVRPERRRPAWSMPVVAAVTGVLMGTVAHIRSEPVILLLPAAVVYATDRNLSRVRRAATIAAMSLAFAVTSSGWSRYFDVKTRTAVDIVSRAGGDTYRHDNMGYHPFWHALFCGLGDFGGQRGYRWRDADAYAYAAPILRRETGAPLTERNPFCFDLRPLVAPSAGLPCDTLEVLPSYAPVIRRKVLSDIIGHPAWYVGVLARRAALMFSDAVPLRLSAGALSVPLPFPAMLLLPGLAAMIWLRAGRAWKILLFLLAPSVTAFAVYSGGGTPHYSVFHHGLAAMVLAAGVRALRRWWCSCRP